ncbi:hypothetical protein K439DRAFT_1632528 [Ramaria rubella]|nr:hypothetical protein K439DRAFT_1632528 [Ramaria rubella]
MSTLIASVLPNPRRVVTGHNEVGKAVLSMDGPLEVQSAADGTIRVANAWTTNSVPAQDNNSDIDGANRTVPGSGLVLPNGLNHRFTDLAPGATTAMHRTSSVDYNILLSGRVVLIVDDDVRTEIEPGTVVIQRGTMHAWHNPSTTEWARWISVLIHAEPAIVNGEALEEVWKPGTAE